MPGADLLRFTLMTRPVPKQSFRALNGGGGFRDPRVSAWEERVGWAARQAMRGQSPYTGELAVTLVFLLTNRRRIDLDNLSKGTLDGMKGIVYPDDTQVYDLSLHKRIHTQAGLIVIVRPATILSAAYEPLLEAQW